MDTQSIRHVVFPHSFFLKRIRVGKRTLLMRVLLPAFTADALQDLTAPYLPSLILVQTLLDTLTTFPPLPLPLAALVSTADQLALAADIQATDATGDHSTRQVVRPSASVLQACMSLLAVQPLLPGKGAQGSEAWEEICAAEVGGWNQ